MFLFSVLFLCFAETYSRYSRLAENYSRLGGQKFPVRAATGIGSQVLGLQRRFDDPVAAITGKSKKFPVRREKPGTLPATEDWLPF